MSPKELAAKHPRLYHITRQEALSNILRYGLLSASNLLTLFGVPQAQRDLIESKTRPISVDIAHPVYGRARLTDSFSLCGTALSDCLDDGLQPADWMRMLNRRVFFWVNEKDVDSHLRASLKQGDKRIVLILDTLSVMMAHFKQVELAAINTGATARRVARRGLTTFTPAHLYSYREWQALRGGNDHVKELAVLDGIRDVNVHMTGYYIFPHQHQDFMQAAEAIG